MEKLGEIVEEAVDGIAAVLGTALSNEQKSKIAKVIEKAAISAKLDGHHSAVTTALNCPEADQDTAHRIANAIERSNNLLIENLKAMR